MPKCSQIGQGKRTLKDHRVRPDTVIKAMTCAMGVPESVFCSMPVLMSTSNRGALLPSMKNVGFALSPQQYNYTSEHKLLQPGAP